MLGKTNNLQKKLSERKRENKRFYPCLIRGRSYRNKMRMSLRTYTLKK